SIPGPHRLVFVLRELEGMSTDEVAQCLGISPDNVKARFHRAKVALRKDIDRRLGRHAPELFAFHLSRCDRIVKNVFASLPAVRSVVAERA
ncbi:MAG: sigma factor-like helix-turn-helix DNA-binding protein, partial [Vicinamibacteria bacterium]